MPSREFDTVLQTSEPKRQWEPRAYEPPKVVRFGSLAQITRSGDTFPGEDGTSQDYASNG
ncbi:MAG: lasso RiPP family leader peptide-containing protein [Polyangiaceae bacterium]|nr:lasso RiPP family leader peptide-containing protein [Polyangiaceae bacterium]